MKLSLKGCLIAVTITLALGAASRTNVQDLTRKLKSSSPKVRAQAALLLGGMRARSAVYFLVDCLKDKNSVVRGTCARALGMIGDDRGLDGVSRVAGDKSPFVRKWARWAAARMVHPDTELRVSLSATTGGTDEMQSAVQDGISRAILDMDSWDISQDQDMDFSKHDDKQPAIEGMGSAPAPVLRLKTRIARNKDGGMTLTIEGVVNSALVDSVQCVIGEKNATDTDKLITMSKQCAVRFAKDLFAKGKRGKK